jgi:hypothetical protein
MRILKAVTLLLFVVFLGLAGFMTYAVYSYMNNKVFLLPTAVANMTAERFDAIKFPSYSWGRTHLLRKEKPARILTEDTDFGIAPSPANSSPETRADLAAMLAMQESERTPDQVEKILFENSVSSPMPIFEKNGLLNAQTHPRTAELVEMIQDEAAHFIYREKGKYERARPHQLEPRIEPIIPVPAHPAYPSGHGGQSWAAALVLSDLDPGNRDAYQRLALDIAHRREIGGVHYPMDAVAGRKIAEGVVREALQSGKIQSLYEKAKQEWSGNPVIASPQQEEQPEQQQN